MKKYAMFYQIDSAGNANEGVGTDSFLPLDGRLNLSNCIDQTREHMKNLNENLGKFYVGFEIRSCGGQQIFTYYRTIYSFGLTDKDN